MNQEYWEKAKMSGPRGADFPDMAIPPPPVPSDTFMTPLSTAYETALSTAKRAEGLADKLTGFVPETAAAGGDMSPNGVFDTIAFAGSEINRSLQRINQALFRIEKALP